MSERRFSAFLCTRQNVHLIWWQNCTSAKSGASCLTVYGRAPVIASVLGHD